jgi:hypothetical protein
LVSGSELPLQVRSSKLDFLFPKPGKGNTKLVYLLVLELAVRNSSDLLV